MWLSTRDVPGHWHDLLLYSVLNVISPVWSLPYFISGTSTHHMVHSERSIPIVIQLEPNIPSFGAYWFFLLHRISRKVILICENLIMVSKFPRGQRSPRIGGGAFFNLMMTSHLWPAIFFLFDHWLISFAF